MTIRVLINGATGKMGQETVRALSIDSSFLVVGTPDKSADLTSVIKQTAAHVVVDFTHPSTVFANSLAIIKAQARPVIGTTGLSADEIKELQQLCRQQKLGGIIAPNFSLGAILMMEFAKMAAVFFPEVEIIELHHPQKADSPSGTALKTAELIATHRPTLPSDKANHEVIPGARGAVSHSIPIHSVRLPGFLASQEIIFGGQGETLSIRHNTLDRACFMAGVRLACKQVMHLEEMLYGLEHLLALANI